MQESQSPAQLESIRHSFAHLLAMAVLKKFPKAKLGIGPVIERGFYYDFKLPEPPTEEDLPTLEVTMRELIAAKLDFHGEQITPQKARALFKEQPFKLELIKEFAKEKKLLTAYTTCPPDSKLKIPNSHCFVDLCRGGHVKNTSEINPESFALTHIAGAYWRGNEKNSQLTRIYGLAFGTPEELQKHLAFLEEAKKRDHKKLGIELDLFTFSDSVGKGLPLWTPKGSVIRRQLERFIVDEEIKRGYLHVYTPDIAKLDLYIKSGHYPHYKDSMYAPIDIDGEKFMLRPMTCPHHFELYLRTKHSYRELPMRIAELAQLYRYEQSGELSGLQRVRTFCLADAHIICTSPEQAMEEISGALDLIEHIARVFGLIMGKEYWYRLSLGNRKDKKKYFKNDAAWDKGESMLRQLLVRRKCIFIEAPDEAAFYGPKVDIQMRNVNGKEDTAFTVQYDFCMPDRFDLSYIDQD
ncbi:MAG: threonyl-tRNA synthetase, partial [Parcubacteria group bacterium Gr01-1014_66]